MSGKVIVMNDFINQAMETLEDSNILDVSELVFFNGKVYWVTMEKVAG